MMIFDKKRLRTYRWMLLPLAVFLWACGGKETTEVFFENTKKIKERSEVLKGNYAVRNGKSTLYYLNGKIQHEAEYQNGALITVKAVFDTAGKKIKDNPISGGSGKLPVYDGSGLLTAELEYKSGFLNGVSKYYDAGMLTASVRYRAGLPEASVGETGNLAASESDTSAKDTSAKKEEKMTISGFDPQSTDALLAKLQRKAYAEIHAGGAEVYKKEISLAHLTKYLNYCFELYGPLKSYNMEAYQIKSMRGMGEGLEVGYSCTFGYSKGMITLVMFRENGQFKLGNIDIMTAEYTPVFQITRAATPILEKLKSKDFESMYQNASSAFKSVTPIADFRTAMNEFAKLGTIESYELYQHHIAMNKGQITAEVIYKIKIAGKDAPFNMILMEEGGSLKLAGFNL